MAEEMDELKKALQEKKAVIGTNRTLKKLKAGKLKKVFVASNCAEPIKQDIRHYSKGLEVKQLKVPNDELGTICKKQFSIAVIGILK